MSRHTSTVSRDSGPGRGAIIPSASTKDIDLDVSRLSNISGSSVVTLGGLEYPVGSRIGSTGAFVIGNPHYVAKGTDSHKSSQSGISGGSQRHLVPGYKNKDTAYNFEYWNWPVIRYVLLVVVLGAMIALLAAVIGIVVSNKLQCNFQFDWWRGSTLYRIPVPYFYDVTKDDIGDIRGIKEKVIYLKDMGIEVIALNRFLPAIQDHLGLWDPVISYDDVDERLGTLSQLQEVIKECHDNDIKVMMEWSVLYTSTDHTWFKESTLESASYQTEYKNFYHWVLDTAQKEAISTTWQWTFDVERSEYYLHMNDSTKPLLDWRSHAVHSKVRSVLEFWLKIGFDGFIMRGLEHMYVESQSTMLTVLSGWRDVLDQYSEDYNRKVLMIESSYLELVEKTYHSLLEPITRTVDLIEVPLGFGPNGTLGLYQDVNRGLRWQQLDGGPWVAWRLVNLTQMVKSYVAPLEMFELMLPGTPTMAAGQEVGVFYDESLNKFSKPMLWKTGSLYPYVPGSVLNSTTIDALKILMRARRDVFSMRMDTSDINREDGPTKQLNYRFLYNDTDTVFFGRHYVQKEGYYFGANFGSKKVTRDWFKLGPRGNVVADSRGMMTGMVKLHELDLERAQGIVYSVIK